MTPFKILTNTLTRLDFDHIDGRAAWGNRGLYQFLSELNPEMAPLLGDDEDFEADGLEPPTPEARAAGERDHAALDAAWRNAGAGAAGGKNANTPRSGARRPRGVGAVAPGVVGCLGGPPGGIRAARRPAARSWKAPPRGPSAWRKS